MKTKQPKTDWRVLCVGILCLTGIELFALSKGINGVLLTTMVGIIALAIGVTIKNPITK